MPKVPKKMSGTINGCPSCGLEVCVRCLPEEIINFMLLKKASDTLAIAVFNAIERGTIETRTEISDALESWAQIRFDALTGNEIMLLRELRDASLAEKPS